MELRQEQPGDLRAVEALYDLCFAPGRMALSSYRLREGVAPLADLCLVVAGAGGAIEGAIRFWPVRVHTAPALLLGPVAVHPTQQGMGLGGLLIQRGIERAIRRQWPRIVLVGDLSYYSRFGLVRLEGVVMPPPTNPGRILGLGQWQGIAGTVTRWQAGDGG